MQVKSYIESLITEHEAFILDHGKTVNEGELKYKDDVTSYSWNIHRNNKLKAGMPVLSRHPGKITKNRKFEIYGGGVVTSISSPDEEGNVIAQISRPFRFLNPIEQGDSFIESFRWDSKTKKVGTWGHFWNQYGMNKISMTDFWKLVEGREYEILDRLAENEAPTDEENQEVGEVSLEFVELIDTRKIKAKKKSNQNNKRKGVHIDFLKKNQNQLTLGKLGEEIVLERLKELVAKNEIRDLKHVSAQEGDGLGYDILYHDLEGREVRVEVKTTSKAYIDGFEMSKNEIEVSQENGAIYKIYRIYNLDKKKGTYSLEIFDGPIDKQDYKVIPQIYKVYLK